MLLGHVPWQPFLEPGKPRPQPPSPTLYRLPLQSSSPQPTNPPPSVPSLRPGLWPHINPRQDSDGWGWLERGERPLMLEINLTGPTGKGQA
ncbi:hypothetical protein J4Q44_G00236290 [Coregonus suidteri]|uniref:Uncharacterized protein n=1 Tax=Coregonus suidteri TaxID=861788 RepID=A0AAN8LCL8_9TELE